MFASILADTSTPQHQYQHWLLPLYALHSYMNVAKATEQCPWLYNCTSNCFIDTMFTPSAVIFVCSVFMTLQGRKNSAGRVHTRMLVRKPHLASHKTRTTRFCVIFF